MKTLLFILAGVCILTACQSFHTAPDTATGPLPAINATGSTWSSQYGGADKSHDTHLMTLREQIAPRFQTFDYIHNGVRISYNLYIPQNLDPNQKYPLVMFIADASTAGKGVQAPLMQGYGGIIWATDESQARNPAFVLVPAYDTKAVNDDWTTSEQVAITPNLVREIAHKYPIDNKRIYATGQSMGGMISFYLNSIEPDLFAASMFVGSQWNIDVLQPLTRSKFIYIVSAADPKASVGMNEVIDLMQKNNVPIAEAEFSARLAQNTQNQRVSQMLAENKSANFIRFSPNTVVPEGVAHRGGEHMYSFDYAYLLEPARAWLFKQSR